MSPLIPPKHPFGRVAGLLALSLLAAGPGATVPDHQGPGAAEPAPSDQGVGVLDAVRGGILQVRTLPLAGDTPESYGTGFVVGPSGAIVTNYHVVVDVVMEPESHRLEFLKLDGSTGPLIVLAIDVPQDLAILRGETDDMTSLPLNTLIPKKGTHAYSIGYPKLQGLTITEGILNGLSENSVRDQLHFSGPLNSGMSGGPTVTRDGVVVGVNVSTMTSAQLVSFVIPSSYAAALVASAEGMAPPSHRDLVDSLNAQVRAYAGEALNLWPAGHLPVRQLGHFQVPGSPGPFASCYADQSSQDDRPYQTSTYSCQYKDWTRVSSEIWVGHWSFEHSLVTAPELGALRFARLMTSQTPGLTLHVYSDASQATDWSCTEQIVALPSGRVKAGFCLRRYTMLQDIYDARLRVTTLEQTGEGLHSTLTMQGFGYAESTALAQRFLEAIAWTP